MAGAEIGNPVSDQLTRDAPHGDVSVTGNERIYDNPIPGVRRLFQVVLRPQPLPRLLPELRPAGCGRDVRPAAIVDLQLIGERFGIPLRPEAALAGLPFARVR
ncbi:hypothetical protein C1S81_08490 [Mycolicibacterium neoaurum]|nr:hypothetical protein C1S81_08490 [Mycolicibacterium neoaurum]